MKIVGGIVFADSFAKNSNPDRISDIAYKIRLANTKRRFKEVFGESFQPWDTSRDFTESFVSGPTNPDDVDGGSPGKKDILFLTT